MIPLFKIPLLARLLQVNVTIMMCPLMIRTLMVVLMCHSNGRNMVSGCQLLSSMMEVEATCQVAIQGCLTQPMRLMILVMEPLVLQVTLAMFWLSSRLVEVISGRPMRMEVFLPLSSPLLLMRLLKLDSSMLLKKYGFMQQLQKAQLGQLRYMLMEQSLTNWWQ